MPQQPAVTQTSLAQAFIDLDELWSHVARAAAADLKALPGAVSIPTGQLHLLRLLDRYGAERMSELAAFLGITMGGCTGLVDRAIEAGLVERWRDADDRRVVWVALTKAGEALLAQYQQARATILTQYLHHLPAAEVTALVDLLRLVADLIQPIAESSATASPADSVAERMGQR